MEIDKHASHTRAYQSVKRSNSGKFVLAISQKGRNSRSHFYVDIFTENDLNELKLISRVQCHASYTGCQN